jgi:hypothetical protein
MNFMGIERERRQLARELADAAGLSAAEIDHAIMVEHEAGLPSKRNLVSTLASVAALTTLLRSIPDGDRLARLHATDSQRGSPLDRILKGEIASVYGDLAEAFAGRYDVSWDGNWPREVARRRLRGQIPPSARPGDVVVGSDGGGVRIDIQVIEDSDGVLTGDVLSNTWRDPPFEDIWLETYRQLEALYPNEVPRI